MGSIDGEDVLFMYILIIQNYTICMFSIEDVCEDLHNWMQVHSVEN